MWSETRYLAYFNIYTDQGEQSIEDFGIATGAVVGLVNDSAKQVFVVSTETFYTYTEVANQSGIEVVGTIRTNRTSFWIN